MNNQISDLEGVVVPLIYPSQLPTVWPYYTEYHINSVEKKCQDYVRSYGISGDKKEEVESTIPTLICMTYPDGTGEQMQFLSDHVTWLILLEAQIGMQYEKVSGILGDIELTLDESLIDDPNNFTTIWGKEHAELFRRYCDFKVTDEQKRLWKKGVLGYTHGTLAKIKNGGESIPVWKYTHIRRDDSANTWYISFVQWCNGVILPKETSESAGFRKIVALTADFINHANDATSYAKKYCCGDSSNIITKILKNYHQLTTQDAFYVVARLSKLVLEEFDKTVDAFMLIPRSKKLRNDVERTILGIRKYISGYAIWNAETKYKLFGDKKSKPEVQLKRIDVTNVTIEERLCKIAAEIFEDTYNKNNSVDLEKLK